MRSDLSELKGEDAILRVATELFAVEGAERVTIRTIAAEAAVSPALVIHHFGSRAGLRTAVEQRVVARFEALIAELDTPELIDEAHGIGELFARTAADEPAVLSFFRRMLVEGGPSADAAFASLFATTKRTMASLDRVGATRPTDDEDTRAAFLLANDLALLLLRDRIAAATGVDPLGGEGMRRWADEVMSVYSTGIFCAPGAPANAAPETESPSAASPSNASPPTAMPETAVPETAVPETAVPETAMPETAMPEIPEILQPQTPLHRASRGGDR